MLSHFEKPKVNGSVLLIKAVLSALPRVAEEGENTCLCVSDPSTFYSPEAWGFNGGATGPMDSEIVKCFG